MGLDERLAEGVRPPRRSDLPPYALAARRPPEPAPLLKRMADWGVPGLGAAVVDGGDLVWAGGFGDAGGGRPVTSATPFQAASISKPVTALAVLRLVAEGRLDLGADVNGYLRSWQLRALGGGGWRPRVTLRQLLSHTAGTTVHGFAGYRRDLPVPSLPEVLDGLPPATRRRSGSTPCRVRSSGTRAGAAPRCSGCWRRSRERPSPRSCGGWGSTLSG